MIHKAAYRLLIKLTGVFDDLSRHYKNKHWCFRSREEADDKLEIQKKSQKAFRHKCARVFTSYLSNTHFSSVFAQNTRSEWLRIYARWFTKPCNEHQYKNKRFACIQISCDRRTMPLGPNVVLTRSAMAIAPINDDKRACSPRSSWAPFSSLKIFGVMRYKKSLKSTTVMITRNDSHQVDTSQRNEFQCPAVSSWGVNNLS